MSIDRFIPHAAAFALAVCTTAGLLGSVDRIANHEQHRAAAELLAESQPPTDVQVAVQRIVITGHRQHA